MLGAWRKRRNEKSARRRECAIPLAQVQEGVEGVVRRVVGPLEEAGLARVETVEGDEAEGGIFMRLAPEREDAAGVEIAVGEDWITLTLGVGYDHEIFVHPTYEWEWELKARIEVVVEGRYREIFTPGEPDARHSSRGGSYPAGGFDPESGIDPGRRSLTMLFEHRDGGGTAMTHYGSLDGVEERLPGGERRYPPYQSARETSGSARD